VSRTAALIVNGKSRRGREWFPLVEAALKDQGIQLTVSKLLQDPKQVFPEVKKVIEQGTELVCVGGGDGTMSGVSKHFIGSESVMGMLPLGTGNSFARDLGIPVDVDQACDVILNGRVEEVDVSEVNGQTFVNVSTVGLTTLVAENLDDRAKKIFGRAVYLVAMFKAVAKMRRFNARIELPDKVLEFRSMQIVVGNGRFHAGPFPITPDASIESGFLSGYSVNTSARGVLLRYALRLWRGKHVEMPEVVPFQAPSLKLETVPIKRIVVDGEIKLKTPADYRVLPRSLKVMVPKDVDLEAPVDEA
jgi:diacylglycerol kinase (ATP)